MKIAAVLAELERMPPSASLLVQGLDGRWTAVTKLTPTYSAPAWTTAPPSNVCAEGPVVVGEK